jgi:hypothetical protein
VNSFWGSSPGSSSTLKSAAPNLSSLRLFPTCSTTAIVSCWSLWRFYSLNRCLVMWQTYWLNRHFGEGDGADFRFLTRSLQVRLCPNLSMRRGCPSPVRPRNLCDWPYRSLSSKFGRRFEMRHDPLLNVSAQRVSSTFIRFVSQYLSWVWLVPAPSTREFFRSD